VLIRILHEKYFQRVQIIFLDFYMLHTMQGSISHEISVRPSAKRVNCDKTKDTSAGILIPYKGSIHLPVVFDRKNGWWRTTPSS